LNILKGTPNAQVNILRETYQVGGKSENQISYRGPRKRKNSVLFQDVIDGVSPIISGCVTFSIYVGLL
jgi:hypothetical protein